MNSRMAATYTSLLGGDMFGFGTATALKKDLADKILILTDRVNKRKTGNKNIGL
jgi:hypothetical protein